MKKDLGKIPAVYPMPVLIVAAYDEAGVPCAMNAAWGMISGMDQITLFIDEDHKTVKNIHASGAFTVALADAAHVAPADYVGIATGNKVADKFARSGLTAVKSAHVNAPIIDQFPLTMECELQTVIQQEDFHAVVGKIVNTCAEESILDENGKVDVTKAGFLMFDQFRAGYYTTGEQAGLAWRSGRELMKDEP